LEQSLAADPRLQGGTVSPAGESPSTIAQLPPNFPAEIPRYPSAELINVSGASASDNPVVGANQPVQTRWRTTDAVSQVQQFYRQKFETGGWQLGSSTEPLQATRDGLQVQVATNGASNQSGNSNGTEFTVSYQLGAAINPSAASPTVAPSGSPAAEAAPTSNQTAALPQPGNPNFIGPTPQAQSSPAPDSRATTSSFSDINQAPTELRSYVTDLAKLGALPLRSSGGATILKPNADISRRDYARWLVTANNQIYSNQPARKIRLAAATDKPTFQDVSSSDPDFGVIQGLANAGLIPSPLAGDAASVQFRPDAPLTREEMILWKVPVDLRQALPNASIDAVQQAWGFQDAAKIDPKALRAVLADYQNGDLANIRRAFGYTTLFQPKKSVSRAEAAAALWQFGSQGSSLSAKDALQISQAPAQ
jgi:hypothetical protein